MSDRHSLHFITTSILHVDEKRNHLNKPESAGMYDELYNLLHNTCYGAENKEIFLEML